MIEPLSKDKFEELQLQKRLEKKKDKINKSIKRCNETLLRGYRSVNNFTKDEDIIESVINIFSKVGWKVTREEREVTQKARSEKEFTRTYINLRFE